MKKIGLILSIVTVLIIGTSLTTKTQQSNTAPHIQFVTESYDFGTIVVGADGNYSFKFTNTGKEPLIIQEVRSSCGCTIPKKPDAPILPGQSEVIKVSYDTKRIGPFQKYITVTSNADNSTVNLTIKGEVKDKPAEEVPVRTNQGFSPVAK